MDAPKSTAARSHVPSILKMQRPSPKQPSSLASRWQMVAPTLAKCPTWRDRWTGHSDWRFMVRIPLLCSQNKKNFLSKAVVLSYKHISTVPPVVAGPLQESLNYTLGSHVGLICEATGVPVPSITWLKDGAPIGKITDKGYTEWHRRWEH